MKWWKKIIEIFEIGFERKAVHEDLEAGRIDLKEFLRRVKDAEKRRNRIKVAAA